ncbi:hypothetical protein JZ751_025677 [Albula glossodonta]|uniref:Uncharacterized protein n=1 Tax=Albula glossodonta TaxID=121402 RepID=A0A8T2N158_9TELE|nr:hypothetical protein JZ751_025677 [Albula glossodonta]
MLWSQLKTPDPAIREICDKVLSQVNQDTRKNYMSLMPLVYREEQLSGGKNYKILVNGSNDYFVITVLAPTPDTAMVTDYMDPMAKCFD